MYVEEKYVIRFWLNGFFIPSKPPANSTETDFVLKQGWRLIFTERSLIKGMREEKKLILFVIIIYSFYMFQSVLTLKYAILILLLPQNN